MYKYEFDKDKCWYSLVCSGYNNDVVCNQGCIRYMEMHYLILTSCIPKNKMYKNELVPQNCDVESFTRLSRIKNDIKKFVDEGKSLYIFSRNFGNGKTTWAIKLMQSYFNCVWFCNGFKERGLFINVPAFLTKVKDAISNKDLDFQHVKDILCDVDIVIWDDIATQKLTEYEHSLLLTYIDARILNGKSNIYTGNLDENELQDYVGNRLKSRIWNKSIIIELNRW